MLNMSEMGPVAAESVLAFPLLKAGVAPEERVKILTLTAEVRLEVNHQAKQKWMKCAGYAS